MFCQGTCSKVVRAIVRHHEDVRFKEIMYTEALNPSFPLYCKYRTTSMSLKVTWKQTFQFILGTVNEIAGKL